MSQDPIALVRQGYEAYARRDYPAVFALLSPDIEIVQTSLLPWGGCYRGPAEAGDFFRQLNEHIESLVEPQEFVSAGGQVAVLGRITGRVRANEIEFDLRIVHIWTVRDDRLARFEAYINTPEMLRALSGHPAP